MHTQGGSDGNRPTEEHLQPIKALDLLYRQALTDSVDEFPRAIIRLLTATLAMEGAVLGLSTGAHGNGKTAAVLRIVNTDDPPESSMHANGFTPVPLLDPLTEAHVASVDAPRIIDCTTLALAGPLGSLNRFVQRERIRHLLVSGNLADASSSFRWALLYRRNRSDFDEEDAMRLRALWPHIARAIDINRRNMLDGLDGRRNHRASALVDHNGAVKAADPAFTALLEKEWPALNGATLPAKVVSLLAAGNIYLGRSIQLDGVRINGRLVFYAKKNPGMVALTPAEQEVASRFAQGKSTKEIANELGVSANTVRTQLSRLYSKLDVHDKAQLAQKLMAA